MLRLRIGFDHTTPEDEATRTAVADWHEACAAAGGAAEAETTVTVIRDDPERVALGEYLVQVEGGCVGYRSES